MLSTLPSRGNNCPHSSHQAENASASAPMELQEPSTIVNPSTKDDLRHQQTSKTAPNVSAKARYSDLNGNSRNDLLSPSLDPSGAPMAQRESPTDNAPPTTTSTSASSTCANSDTAACSSNKASISFPLLNPKDTIPPAVCCATYPANNPCEDRFAILSNVILKPASYTTSSPAPAKNPSTARRISCETSSKRPKLRLSMFCVLDGHGGPAASEHASKTFLPLLQTKLAEGLNCNIDKEGHFFTSGDVSQTRDNDREFVADGYDHYRAPAVKDSGISIPKVERIDIDDENERESDGLSSAKTSKFRQDPQTELSSRSLPIVSDTSSEENLSDEDKALHVPGVPSSGLSSSEKKEQISTITNILRESFVEWDEMYLNSISLSERQEGVMKNGPCNSGACCLVNLLVQNEVPQGEASSKEASYFGECRLYSAHVGDCRSVVYTRSSTNKAWNRTAHATDQSDHDEDKDSDFDEKDVTFSDDSSSEEEGDEYPTDSDKEEDSIFLCRHEYQPAGKSLVDESQPRPIWKRARLMQQSSSDAGNLNSSSSTGTHRTSLRRKRRFPQINPAEQSKESFQATALTTDHTPYDETERRLVEERTYYYSRAIAKASNGGILRVGGSLSVTRALGDAYLKHKPLSFPPYEKHVPFLTATPSVSSRVLNSFDHFLILGSDGVWERCTEVLLGSWLEEFENDVSRLEIDRENDQYCRRIVGKGATACQFSELSDTKVSDFIVKRILTVVAGKQQQSFTEFQALRPGQQRRAKHDDITACVIDLRRIIESKVCK